MQLSLSCTWETDSYKIKMNPRSCTSRAVRWWLDAHVSIRISRWTATGENNVLLLYFSEANTVFSLSVTYRGAARCTRLKPEWHKSSWKENRVSWFRFDVKMNPVDNRIQMQNRHHHPPRFKNTSEDTASLALACSSTSRLLSCQPEDEQATCEKVSEILYWFPREERLLVDEKLDWA